MILLRVTADRTSGGLVARDRRVLGEVPDETGYWDPVCDLILRRMERDGVIDKLERDGVIEIEGNRETSRGHGEMARRLPG